MKTSLVIFVASLLLFTVGLSGQEVISFDARFYLFALEMWRHGATAFPTTYGVYYPDYPVTSTLFIYVASWLFGGLNKFTAVLPSAVAAALTVVMTFKIGSLKSRKEGFYAVFILLGTLAFLKSARAIALDMYPVLITTVCFYLVHAASVRNDKRCVKWIYPLFVISFIFRGPIGLVMPTGVVCIYYLLARNFRQFFVTGLIALLLLVISTAGLLLLAFHVGGSGFLQDVLRMEVIGRFGGKTIPLMFYFRDSFVSYSLAYPFAFLVMLCVLFRPANRYLLQLTGWVLVIMIGMSVPGDKKVRYVLPMAPALALLVASLWAEVPRQKWLVWVRQTAILLYLIMPTLFFVVTVYVMYMADRVGMVSAAPFYPMMIFFGVVQLLAFSFYFAVKKVYVDRLSWVIFLGTMCFVAANLLLVEPLQLRIDRTRDFVKTVETMRLQKNARLVFYRERADGLPIKYLVNMSDQREPLFVNREKDLRVLSAPAVVMTDKDVFEALAPAVQASFRVLMNGRVGHVEVVVFEPTFRGNK